MSPFLKYNPKNREVEIVSPEIFLIDEIADIKNKCLTNEEMLRELAFVHFMTWHRSPYNKYDNKVERIENDLKIKYNSRIEAAVNKFNELVDSFEIQFLNTTIELIKKTEMYFKNVNYSITHNGKPIYTPKEIFAAIKQVPDTLQALKNALDNIKETDNISAVIAKGSRVVSNREEPKSINRGVID